MGVGSRMVSGVVPPGRLLANLSWLVPGAMQAVSARAARKSAHNVSQPRRADRTPAAAVVTNGQASSREHALWAQDALDNVDAVGDVDVGDDHLLDCARFVGAR